MKQQVDKGEVFLVVAIIVVVLLIVVCYEAGSSAQFGLSSTVGTGDGYGYARAVVTPVYSKIVTSDIVIDSIYIHGRKGSSTNRNIDVAVYKKRNGLPTDKIWSKTITFTSVTAYWLATACTVSVYAPDTICLAFGNQNNTYTRVSQRDSVSGVGSNAADTTLPNPWVQGSTSAKLWAFYAVYHEGTVAADSCTKRVRMRL